MLKFSQKTPNKETMQFQPSQFHYVFSHFNASLGYKLTKLDNKYHILNLGLHLSLCLLLKRFTSSKKK